MSSADGLIEFCNDFFSCDWGGQAGCCLWDCWKCNPCCGDPWDPLHAIYCFLCFCTPAALITWPYVCAEDLGQDCAVGNHFLPFFTVNCITSEIVPCGIWSCIRHNRRVRYAEPDLKHEGCPSKLGDFICVMTPFLPCILCQMCRSMERDQWNWPKKCSQKPCCQICVCPFKCYTYAKEIEEEKGNA